MSLTTLFILVIFGCITSLIAKKRHLGYDKFGDQAPLAFFIFGALLFIVALPWVILAPAGQKQSPDSQH
jgi:vacuolar-type H+-ATPase subunit I/STV1